MIVYLRKECVPILEQEGKQTVSRLFRSLAVMNLLLLPVMIVKMGQDLSPFRYGSHLDQAVTGQKAVLNLLGSSYTREDSVQVFVQRSLISR